MMSRKSQEKVEVEGSGNDLRSEGTAYAQRTKPKEVCSWCLEGTKDRQAEQDVTNTSLEARTSQTPHEKMTSSRDFPGGPVVKNPLSNAGNAHSISGWRTKTPQATAREAPTPQLEKTPGCNQDPARCN